MFCFFLSFERTQVHFTLFNMGDKENPGCCSAFRFFSCPKRMTEKIAFVPPSPPYYDLEEIDPDRYDYAFMISPDVDTTGLRHVKRQRSRYVTTSKGNKIAVLYVNCNERNKSTIIYSHGNAVDLGQIHKLCTEFSVMLECDVVAYDYSGYGRSEGRPSEENLYADIQAVWEYTITLHETRPENIILFGQSLGTCPSIDLASKEQCAGVILQSPFTSAFDVACPKRRWCKNVDQFRK